MCADLRKRNHTGRFKSCQPDCQPDQCQPDQKSLLSCVKATTTEFRELAQRVSVNGS